MSDVDGASGPLGIDHLEARWDIMYHVLNAGGGLPSGTPSALAPVPKAAEALVNLPDDGSHLWFLARPDRALFFFPSFVIFPVQADDSR
jgi:hypothetical protein